MIRDQHYPENDIRHWGASPNQADNSEAIQLAVDAADRLGKRLITPPGIWRHATTIEIPTGAQLVL